MAQSLNRWTGVGNLTRDPEQRFLPDGTECTSFSIAISDDTKDRATGNVVKRTEYVPLECIGNLARICNQFLKKGKQVYVEGKFKTRSYEQNGERKFKVAIHLENMQMLGGRDDNLSADHPPQAPAAGRPAAAPAPSFSEMDDQIPF